MNLSKYSASGNDFVIFSDEKKEDRTELAKVLCHRQNGVGADGLIVIVPNDKYDFEWEFYNADGSLADMCGNGSRAAAHYALNHGKAKEIMSFMTGAGVINAEVRENTPKGAMVKSELTPPVIIEKNINYNDKNWWLINTGVPHLVCMQDNVNSFDLVEARELRHKYNANVNICCVVGENLQVRTYERGVEDETLACGTGMAACFYRALQEQEVAESIEVYPTSGETLYLGVNERTITFMGRVVNTFNTEWEV